MEMTIILSPEIKRKHTGKEKFKISLKSCHVSLSFLFNYFGGTFIFTLLKLKLICFYCIT